MTRLILAAATGVAALAIAGGASAQAAATALSSGPPVPNMCIMSVDAAITNSTVGKFVDTRLQQLASQVNAELNAEGTAINNDAKALDAQRASLDQGTLEKRAADLQVRANAFQRKQELRRQELGVTEQKAIGRIQQDLLPLIRQIYEQRKCSVLLRGELVVAGGNPPVFFANPAMDITQQVVTALNSKITQFAFERERLDQAAAAPAAKR